MDADNLMKMANQIGYFFESMPDREEAQKGVVSHIRNSWDPRMRKSFLKSIETKQDAVLSDFVKGAIVAHRALLT
jgi:formate dehydrogenase subunit delta